MAAILSDSEQEFTMEEEKPKLKIKLKVKPEVTPSSSNGDAIVAADEAAKKKKKKKKDKEKKRKLMEAAAADVKPATKKVKLEKGSAEAVVKTAAKQKGKKLKELDPTERLTYAMQSFLWWDADEPPEGCQWRTMEHAGVSFPESYVPHGIKLKYDGKEVDLTPAQEEAATFFAATDPDGMHLGNPKTAKIFIKNFFTDFKAILGRGHIIKDFNKCDFEPIRSYLNEQKIIKKAISDAERKANKAVRDELAHKFGFALVDGHLEKVGNYNMEPPGTFRGYVKLLFWCLLTVDLSRSLLLCFYCSLLSQPVHLSRSGQRSLTH